MNGLLDSLAAAKLDPSELVGSAPVSEAGPIEMGELAGLPRPPSTRWPRPIQVLWFGLRHWDFVHYHRAKLGQVWTPRAYVRGAGSCHLPPRPRALAVHRTP